MKQVSSNVVVVAKNFNPSILSQIWLVKHEIVAEEEFEPGSVCLEAVSQVTTKYFELLVVPDRLQLTPRARDADGDAEKREGGLQGEGELVAERVSRIVRALPHTPYTAVGMNFLWHENPQEEDIAHFSRRLFFNPKNPVYYEFGEDNANFGAYMSKNVGGGMRLKFDIKPVTATSAEHSEQRLQLAFNFHKDLTEGDRVEQVVAAIRRWNECKQQAAALAELSVRGG